MKGKIFVLALGLVLVAAACNQPATDNTQDTTQQTPSPTPAPTPIPTPTPAASPKTVTINITSSGFSPSTVSINRGDIVTFINQDNKSRWPASAPHPTHTDYPEFDPKAGIAAGASWSFTFDKTGTWRFHDHLNPSQFGSVTVQ